MLTHGGSVIPNNPPITGYTIKNIKIIFLMCRSINYLINFVKPLPLVWATFQYYNLSYIILYYIIVRKYVL